jgi:glucose-1-phosphate cytidylyltransferase
VGEGWINGGFFVLEPEIVHYIQGDPTVFEKEPMEKLAQEDQLVAYRHYDFWHMMDTLRDLKALEKMWAEQDAPWKVW